MIASRPWRSASGIFASMPPGRVPGVRVLPPVPGRNPPGFSRHPFRGDPRVEAFPAPDPVPVLLDAVPVKRVAAEGRLDAVRGRETEIVVVENVVVRAPLPR